MTGLNGGLGSNDDPAHVAENRRRMAEQMGVAPDRFLSLHQIHSPDAVVATGPWQGAHGRAPTRIVTRTEGLAIGVTAADCGPILFVDPDRARDRRGACGLEGRADRRDRIHRGRDGKTRRRPRRHGRGDRPADPPALL